MRSNEIYREIYESQSRGRRDFDQVQAENAGKECGMMEDRQSSRKKSGQAQSSRKEQTGRQEEARETKGAIRVLAASSYMAANYKLAVTAVLACIQCSPEAAQAGVVFIQALVDDYIKGVGPTDSGRHTARFLP